MPVSPSRTGLPQWLPGQYLAADAVGPAMISEAYPVQWTGQQAIIEFPDHIDVSNAGQIREELLSAINRGATSLVADMTATISCDHAGADAIVRAYQRAVISGTELRLVVTAEIVRRVLSIGGIDRLVSIYPSLEAATAARAPAVVLTLAARPATGRRAYADGKGMADAPAVIRQTFDAFQDGVALANDDGTITLANMALEAMFGYQHGELVGQPVEYLVPADLKQSHLSLREGYDRAPRTRSMSAGTMLVGLRKDSTTFPAEISLTPIPTIGGQFTLAVVRDVTETRRLEDLVSLARTAVAAEEEHRSAELLDTVVTTLFHVGLSLQACIGQPAEITSQRISEVLENLDRTIRHIRDTAFAIATHPPSG